MSNDRISGQESLRWNPPVLEELTVDLDSISAKKKKSKDGPGQGSTS